MSDPKGDFGGYYGYGENISGVSPDQDALSSAAQELSDSLESTSGTYGFDQTTSGDYGSYYPVSGQSPSGVFGDYPSDYDTSASGISPEPSGVSPGPTGIWEAQTVLERLAEQIYDQEFAYEEGERRLIEIKFIRDWLEGNLGELNTMIYTCFEGPDPESLFLEEQAILRELYIVDYNRRAQRNALRFINGFRQEQEDWFLIKEGDSTIQRTTHTHKEVASKNYRLAATDAMNRVKDLVFRYNLRQSTPKDVLYTDKPNNIINKDHERR